MAAAMTESASNAASTDPPNGLHFPNFAETPVSESQQSGGADGGNGVTFLPPPISISQDDLGTCSLPLSVNSSNGDSRTDFPPLLSDTEELNSKRQDDEEEEVESISEVDNNYNNNNNNSTSAQFHVEEEEVIPAERFRIAYACRPSSLQRGNYSKSCAEQAMEFRARFASVRRDMYPNEATYQQLLRNTSMREEELEETKTDFWARQADKSKMSRPDHRHGLQQLVVEAYRWRNLAVVQNGEEEYVALDIEEDEDSAAQTGGQDQQLPRQPTSPTSAGRSPVMKSVTSAESVESLCGLSDETTTVTTTPAQVVSPLPQNTTATNGVEKIAPELQPEAEGEKHYDPLQALQAPVSMERTVESSNSTASVTVSSTASISSTSSTLSSCNRQPWKSTWPIPEDVPPREKADHTSQPLDVSDRAMLYGVLDDIDSVMTTSDLGDDGLPNDRYSEVLANLQFLGLFRPKYAEGQGEGDEEECSSNFFDDELEVHSEDRMGEEFA